jgi:hypothetical protein
MTTNALFSAWAGKSMTGMLFSLVYANAFNDSVFQEQEQYGECKAVGES